MRDDKISIAKGIAIILMVVGHSGCPEILHDFIYLFHMPLFFILSGWTFKEDYLDNKKNYTIKRVKRLYWPFVKYGIIFLALHNIFCHLHLYDLSPITDGKSYTGFYNLRQFLDKFLAIITMRGNEQLLGGFWFLKALLFASLASLWGLYFTNAVIGRRNENKFILTGAILLILILMALARQNTLYAMSALFFMLGFIAKQYAEKIPWKWAISIPLLAIICVGAALKPMTMLNASSATDVIYFITISLAGTYLSFIVANLLTKTSLRKYLIFIGNNTMGILVFHLLCFKLVSLIKIWQYGLPISALGDFPVILTNNSLYWIIYSVVGVCVPLVLDYAFRIKGGLYFVIKH